MEFRGKSVLIIGAGEEAAQAARYLLSKGSKVWLLGNPAAAKTFEKNAADILPKIQVFFSASLPEDAGPFDAVLCTEAKKEHESLLADLKKSGASVRTPLELLAENAPGKIVAVTGTNGKSSTAKMIELMLQKSKIGVTLAGGSFPGFIEALPGAQKSKVLLLEVNSHQLADAELFHPHLAVMTNLTRAHKDRHGSSKQYGLAKAKVFALQGAEDWLIYNADNEPLVKLLELAPTVQKLPIFIPQVPNPYREKKPTGPHASFVFEEKKIQVVLPDGSREAYDTQNIPRRAQHDFENGMEAVACARLLGATPQAVQEVLDTYTGLPHRLQKVSSTKGVDWFDDSRASNPAATAWGIWSFSAPLVLITGGHEIHADYRPLAGPIKEKVKLLILVGQSRRSMHAVFDGLTEVYLVKTLEEAVNLAYAKAAKGDAVLYSPACPPEPGLFASIESRGERFAELFKKEKDLDLSEGKRKVMRVLHEKL